MNEKFFDLKKEKQDRMINASLKIFATAGYAHASTDDIVREAGVSKGLLFHYFTSKLGLYTFLYDYATKFEQLEMSTVVGKEEQDYFTLRSQILKAQANCMKGYPYMTQFIDRAECEDHEEAVGAVGARVAARRERMDEILSRANALRFKPEADVAMIGQMLTGAFRVLLSDYLMQGSGKPETWFAGCEAYLDMMRKLSYRDEAEFMALMVQAAEKEAEGESEEGVPADAPEAEESAAAETETEAAPAEEAPTESESVPAEPDAAQEEPKEEAPAEPEPEPAPADPAPSGSADSVFANPWPVMELAPGEDIFK